MWDPVIVPLAPEVDLKILQEEYLRQQQSANTKNGGKKTTELQFGPPSADVFKPREVKSSPDVHVNDPSSMSNALVAWGKESTNSGALVNYAEGNTAASAKINAAVRMGTQPSPYHEQLGQQVTTRKVNPEALRMQQARHQQLLFSGSKSKNSPKEADGMVEDTLGDFPDDDDEEGPTSQTRPNKKKRTRSPPANPCVQFDADVRTDYQGRSFFELSKLLTASTSVTGGGRKKGSGNSIKVPTKLVHAFKGHGDTGVQFIRWVAPKTGALFLSADLSGKVLLWDALSHRKKIGEYLGHHGAITSLAVSPCQGGSLFSTAGYDGYIRHWDTESGKIVMTLDCMDVFSKDATQQQLSNVVGGVPCCRTHCFVPMESESNLLIAGVERRIVIYDIRLPSRSAVVREYDRHLGSVLSIAVYEDPPGALKFISTAEDKTLRTWDYNLPVQMQVFADAAMHAMPHVAQHPLQNSFVANSLDNRAVGLEISSTTHNLRWQKNRVYSGHVISGTGCQLGFSCDGSFLSSGDAEGNFFIWNYESLEKMKSFKAHKKVIVSHMWHPVEKNLVLTSSWDGLIKAWSS